MKFEKALKAMREGKKVREKCWHPWEAMWMYHGKLFWYDSPKLYKEEVNDISAYLILADDWEVINE